MITITPRHLLTFWKSVVSQCWLWCWFASLIFRVNLDCRSTGLLHWRYLSSTKKSAVFYWRNTQVKILYLERSHSLFSFCLGNRLSQVCWSLNLFAPKVPVTARADSHPLYHMWRHQFKRSRTTLSAKLCGMKRTFKPHQNEHDSVKESA